MAGSESDVDLSALSPDVRAKLDAKLKAAGIKARSAQKTTKWTVAGAIVVALITGLTTYFVAKPSASRVNSPALSSPVKLSFSLTNPADGSSIGQVINVSGSVSGLDNGELIWTFNEPLADGGRTYFPNTGPCTVAGDTWSCDQVDVGGPATPQAPKNGVGPYRIWAVIVSANDAFTIVNHIRCFPSGKASIVGAKIVSTCPDSYSELPGRDIYMPQQTAVTRTH
jgi:hypothetical protein